MGTAGSKPVDVPKAPASVSVLTLQELRAFIYLCLKPLSFIVCPNILPSCANFSLAAKSRN